MISDKWIKTAVCMYGFLRTYDVTANSLIKHILELNDADLFVFCPDAVGASNIPQGANITDYKIKNRKLISKTDVSGDRVTEKMLKEKYGKYLKKCKIYNYDQSRFEKMANKIEGYCVIPTYRVCSLLYNVSGSVNLMLDYAKEHNTKYDCVILLRPDLAFYSDLVVKKLDLASVWLPLGGGAIDRGNVEIPQYYVEYYKNTLDGEMIRYNSVKFTDQLLISSFDNMSVLGNTFSSLYEYAGKKFPFHAESILYYELCRKGKLGVKYLKDFYYEIFRNNYLTIENHALLNGLSFSEQPKARARDYELQDGITREYMRSVDRGRIKKRIKSIIKLLLYPIKKFTLCLKHFLIWLWKD